MGRPPFPKRAWTFNQQIHVEYLSWVGHHDAYTVIFTGNRVSSGRLNYLLKMPSSCGRYMKLLPFLRGTAIIIETQVPITCIILNTNSLNNDSGLEAEKAIISTKGTDDSNFCTSHSNPVRGTYFNFWIIGIQLWWKDGQHGLAHFSHPRDQLGLDCIRILKRQESHKNHCYQGSLPSVNSMSLALVSYSTSPRTYLVETISRKWEHFLA